MFAKIDMGTEYHKIEQLKIDQKEMFEYLSYVVFFFFSGDYNYLCVTFVQLRLSIEFI